LGKLSGEDWDRFLALGVSVVIDLRYPWEIDAKGRVPESDTFEYHNLSIEHRQYDQAQIDANTDPWRFLADRYAEVAADGASEIRQALELIATASGPVVFHCAAGKDRTGLLAALVLSILGVDENDVVDDYALTELATEGIIADWRRSNPDRDLPWPFFGRAPAKIMELTLADLAATHGSVQAYLTDTVGIADSTITAMRQTLLVDT
jgi:protein-tyrosine phosphatase